MRNELQVSDAKMRVLRSATSIIVMCGWSVVLQTPVALLLACNLSGTDGFTTMCESLTPLTVYFWVGVVVISIGSLMQATMRKNTKDFAWLVFAAFCGGISVAMLAFMAQFLFLPWAIGVVLIIIYLPILVYFWRGGKELRTTVGSNDD